MNCCNAYGCCVQGPNCAARSTNPTGSVWFVDSELSPPEELASNPVPPEAGCITILKDADDWLPLSPIDEIKLYSFVGVFLLAWIALISAFSGYSWKAWGPSLMAYLSAALLP